MGDDLTMLVLQFVDWYDWEAKEKLTGNPVCGDHRDSPNCPPNYNTAGGLSLGLARLYQEGMFQREPRVKTCPDCGMDVAHYGGKFRMRCVTCNHQFCWTCGKPTSYNRGEENSAGKWIGCNFSFCRTNRILRTKNMIN